LAVVHAFHQRRQDVGGYDTSRSFVSHSDSASRRPRSKRHGRADLDERMAQLKKLRDTLDDCIGCGCLSIDRCRLRNPFDKLAAKGPGPARLWVERWLAE
jgi:hypothetical protein